jgi:hypothetical protein
MWHSSNGCSGLGSGGLTPFDNSSERINDVDLVSNIQELENLWPARWTGDRGKAMLSYEQLRDACGGTTPPAPEDPATEPTVFAHILQQYAEPYPPWLQEALTEYHHLRRVAPQLLPGFLLALWWERGRSLACTSPGRYR